MDKQINAPILLNTVFKTPQDIKRYYHDYYMKAFEGWKSPEEYQLDIDTKRHFMLTDKEVERCLSDESMTCFGSYMAIQYGLMSKLEKIGWKSPEEVEKLLNDMLNARWPKQMEQARQDTFREVGEYLGVIIDNQDDDIDVHLMALVKNLKSGQPPVEKKE